MTNLDKYIAEVRGGLRQFDIKLLLSIIEKQRDALARLKLVGPPSRPTTGEEWASVALKDNCNIARQVESEIEKMLGDV